MKKLLAVFCLIALSVMFSGIALGADDSATTTKQPAQKVQAPQRSMAMNMNRNISFISGTISKVDTTIPGSPKVEIVNSSDGKTHTVEVGPNTNILKVVEVSELKNGDKARIVAKKMDDKETAISIVTGNLKEIPMARPRVATQAPVSAAVKNQTKK